MSNWGGPTKPGSGGDWFERSRPAYLIIVTVALLAFGAALVASERYQLDQASGVPTRLDRFTGQVIACVPQRGCVEFIPAGNPPLATVMPGPKAAAPSATPKVPAPAPAPAAAPAAK
jgi:hypothetical protein